MWVVHYANRGFYFPLSIRAARGEKGSFSALVMVTGWGVTALHGYFHATYFTRLGHYTDAWLTDPRFIAGFVIYYASLALNVHADATLRNLRSPEEAASGKKVYRIPEGGLFRWVTSPSYLTELIAWAAVPRSPAH